MKKLFIGGVVLSLILLASCSDNSPGPLEGAWQSSGMVPMRVVFSDGQVNEMGVISPVSYDVEGSVVTMTYNAGVFKGNSVEYVVEGNHLTTAFGTMQRVAQ